MTASARDASTHALLESQNVRYSVSERSEDDEDDFLQKIDYLESNSIVRIQTSSREYELDVRKVGTDELKKMSMILKKMNYDQKFQTSGL